MSGTDSNNRYSVRQIYLVRVMNDIVVCIMNYIVSQTFIQNDTMSKQPKDQNSNLWPISNGCSKNMENMSESMEEGHINLEKIISCLGNQPPGQDRDEIEGHLAICPKCHAAYLGLRSITESLSQAFKEDDSSSCHLGRANKEDATLSCPDDWEIAALIRKEAAPEVSEEISKHIGDCEFCLGRAARYYKCLEEPTGGELKTPELWKERAIQALRSETRKEEKKISTPQRIVAFFQTLSALLPPLPGYALAALAIIILIWSHSPDNKAGRERIITIASSERIITRSLEIPPALGFMGAGEAGKEREKKTDHTMEIKLKDDEIIFTWQPIENASIYKFSLLEKKSEERPGERPEERPEGETIFSQADLEKPQASIKANMIDKDKHKLYSWVIEGELPEEKCFEYRGDFILVR